MAVTSRPKESKASLEPTTNTYAVQNGILWDYYSVKFGDRKGQFVALAKLPPVLKEGYVTYQRRLFKVELRDFVRSRFNVEQPAYIASTTGSGAGAVVGTPTLVNTDEDKIKSGTGSDLEPEVCKAANLAWEDQISTLLSLIDPEEEWDYKAVT